MSNKKIYFENLDGIRFLCFLTIFLFHSFSTEFDSIKEDNLYILIKEHLLINGNIGVNFFFVLSGFLITYLLITEKKLNGQIDILKFWLRRILRIWPLYYFCVFFGFYAFPVLKSFFGQTPEENASLIHYLTFTNNFDFIEKGFPDASILCALWSVAIEEQFYFIWPIILFILPIKKHPIAFFTIIAISIVFRVFNFSFIMHEHHSLSCIGDMATGAFGAWLVIEKKRFKNFIINLNKPSIWIIYIIFFLIFFFRKELLYSIYIIRLFERQFISSIILLIILEQCYCLNSIFKISKLKKISNLGTITYGLYCLHFIAILTTKTLTNKLGFNTKLWQVLLIDTITAFLISLVIAQLSYKYFEKPFLKLKQNFSFFTK